MHVNRWELLVRSLRLGSSVNRTSGTRGEYDISENWDGELILGKERKQRNELIHFRIESYIELVESDDKWSSGTRATSDRVGVNVFKRCFCRSRTDNRGFDLSNRILSNLFVRFQMNTYNDVCEFRMTLFKLSIITSNSWIVPIFRLCGNSSSKVDQVIACLESFEDPCRKSIVRFATKNRLFDQLN